MSATVAAAGARPGAAPAWIAPWLGFAALASMLATRWETAALTLAAAAAGAMAAGAPWPRAAWRRAFAVGALLALAANLWLTPGTALPGVPAIAGRSATREGLGFGVVVVLRLLAAGLAMHALLATRPAEAVAGACARALRPLLGGRAAGELGAAVALGLRLGPTLGSESERIARVQALRAGRKPRGFAERWRWRRAALVPVVSGALERAERVALAIEARHAGPRLAAGAGTPGLRKPAWGGVVAGLALAAVAIAWRA